MSISGINSTQPIRFNEKQKEKANYAGNAILGMWTAAGAGVALRMGTLPHISNGLEKAAEQKPDEVVIAKEAIDKALKNSGLEKKGVKIVRIDSKKPEGVDKVIESVNNYFDKKIGKYIKDDPKKSEQVEKIRKVLAANDIAVINQIAEGKNAAFYKHTNQIILHEEQLQLGAFHEMGHAMNKNMSKIGKALQAARPVMLAAPAMLLFSAFTRTKEESDDKKLTVGQKVTNFIRKHVGALTLAAFAPVLIEEGMASYKGNKLAKEVLNEKMLKKVNKMNIQGFKTYGVIALATAIAAKAGVYVVDKLHENHQRKVKHQ